MRNNKVLWVVQGLLAALFLFAGGAQLVLPAEAMKGPIELPVSSRTAGARPASRERECLGTTAATTRGAVAVGRRAEELMR
jgi:hypothetical protein